MSHTKLLTKELREKIPPLYSQENNPDPLVICKFFTPDSNWTWYVIEGSTREREGCGWAENCNHKSLPEYDPQHDDVLFYGFVKGIESELGYFSLSELESVRGALGLLVERDRFFQPCQLSDITRV